MTFAGSAPRERALELPSLFEAVKGKRDTHIDDWDGDSEKVWAWKSDLPATRRDPQVKDKAAVQRAVELLEGEAARLRQMK